jgi:ATP-dependent DNA helicase RecG
MNRLLQGDVGVGKTIVALLAALVAMENGLQVAVMSPTEILAEQHYLNLEGLLRPSRFEAILLTGTLGVKARREAWDRLASGAAHLAVGTQALIQDAVRFKDLGLVIIDEQHRFGVLQRATLREKGFNPDVLVMTATPIPRTLALTAYGDLDVSVIRDLPPGRQPIETRLQTEGSRPQVYDFIHKQLDGGRQVYVVCPLVEESGKLDLKAATEMSEHLARDVFPGYRVALVHGRMKASQREEIMQAFATGEVNLLVATTIVEVGVDVPNASVMLIEHAERFGLAQLHQLRGRVGRGAHQSRCVLLHQTPLGEIARLRLEAVVATTDGFEIAERDLELRGPGDFFGTRQSGVPILRVGDLLRDKQLMEGAREAALNWLDSGEDSAPVLAAVRAGWAERFGLAGVG